MGWTFLFFMIGLMIKKPAMIVLRYDSKTNEPQGRQKQLLTQWWQKFGREFALRWVDASSPCISS
jgi:hypothetical protein